MSQSRKRDTTLEISEILRAFLNAFWLRPEVALIKTYECVALKKVEFKEPSLDIGCGDGIFTFISSGGRFGVDFDMYQNVSQTRSFFKGVDVYNTFDRSSFKVNITRRADRKITVGLDSKESLLKKASPLGIFRRVVVADANKKLPFEDGSFKTIYSNIVYVLKDIEHIFRETERILSDDGRALYLMPNEHAKKIMVYHYYKKYGWEWAKLIDRNKYATTYPTYHKYDMTYWEKALKKASLVITQKILVRPDLVHIIWDIGLRPLFPALIEMYKRLDKENRLAVKKVWVENLHRVLLPFCFDGWMYKKFSCKPTYYLLEIGKK